MQYLARTKAPPRLETLTEADQRYVQTHFDAHPAELTVQGEVIRWQDIDEVEVARAARQRTLAGWIVRNVVYAQERYHVGIYCGTRELVMTNVTLEVARFAIQSIAHYMQVPIKYSGIEGMSAVVERD